MGCQSQLNVDPDSFRKVFSQVPTSLALVTAQTDQGPVGMVIGTLMSVSLSPLLVGFLAERDSHTGALIQCAPRVTFNVLGKKDAHLVEVFCGPPDLRFADAQWIPSSIYGPRLDTAVVAIQARAHSVLPAGDHVMVIFEVSHLYMGSEENPALVYLRGSPTNIEISSHPKIRAWQLGQHD